jgi:hypothetical protein
MEIFVIFGVFGHEKTNPIYSFCVPRAADCVKEFEKTKPIAGLRPEIYALGILSTKF